jgi:23S rRNA (cytidine1920-2'-O)/16S rRNA (cytidine1409-2'-O)-methyltransferase
MEKTNAHYPFPLPEQVEMATVDVSFISVTSVIPNMVEHLVKPGYLIVLIKPQFEAERSEVGRGGIIRDPFIHARVLGRFVIWLTEYRLRLRDMIASPVYGAEGNKEFLALLEWHGQK